jgi:hypothetical protein
VAIAAVAAPSSADRANIALSTTIVRRIGDGLWPNWSKTPFDIELLTAHGAVPINIKKPVSVPSFPPQLEATFPLSNGISTIVIGQPQFAAAKTPTRWSVTLLHEHFHQWQYSWPGYLPAVRDLGLAQKNDNGMWMLNYPFPYTQPALDRAYATMAHDLADALSNIGTSKFAASANRYFAARSAFKSGLGAKDYRYFAFQCWQEGTARYTEISVARLAAAAHASDPTFLTDAQAAALSGDSAHTYARTFGQLRNARLHDDERVAFYALGAGEALLLDRIAPGWHARYLDPKMDLSLRFPGSL